MIRRGNDTTTAHRRDALMRALLAGARRDAALTRGGLRRAVAAGHRELAGARAGLAPVRRELRRLGGVRSEGPPEKVPYFAR